MPGVFRTERAGRFCKQFVSIFFPNAPDKTKRTGRPFWQAAGPLFNRVDFKLQQLKTGRRGSRGSEQPRLVDDQLEGQAEEIGGLAAEHHAV